ncbi:hypothetical protein BOTNAR_0408g00100 [Botryotinia narcissicola]|uniref:Uncharacterized protein n=1 Tax=Botryotinia narcissicola TaxID=278944 RepID=A0A4Z1HMD4_9HELO|nr:hypothetical protein BOTNAR_0408g00100 [Botryotinia narcissicola]
MPPSRNESTALAATGDKVQRADKKLTHGKHFSRDQAVKIRKLRLQSLQGMKKRQTDHTITRMLNRLSMDSDVVKKRETTIKNRSERSMGVTFEMDVDLEQETITNQQTKEKPVVNMQSGCIDIRLALAPTG